MKRVLGIIDRALLELVVIAIEGSSKSSHQIQNPLLSVTEPRTRDNTFFWDIVQLIWVPIHQLLEIKQQIYWQEQDLNIRSQDLNQTVSSQLELPRKRSGTGRTEITKKREFTTGLKEAKGLI
jgi:hypothetical protein